MEYDFGRRKIEISRRWLDMIKPLYKKSKEDYDLFYMACMGYALRAEQYGDSIDFEDSELQALYRRTFIRRWEQDKPAVIDIIK